MGASSMVDRINRPGSFTVPSDFVESAENDEKLFEDLYSDEKVQQKLTQLPSPPSEAPFPSEAELKQRLQDLKDGTSVAHPDAALAARARAVLGRVLPELEQGMATLPKGEDPHFGKRVGDLVSKLRSYKDARADAQSKLAASGYADLLRRRLQLEGTNLKIPVAERQAYATLAREMTNLRGDLTAQLARSAERQGRYRR